MGAQLSTQAPTAVVSIDAYVAELTEFTYTGDLSRARFLKTVKTLHREGEAVTKVFIKPTLGFDLSEQRQVLEDYQKVLVQLPNAIGYSRMIENDRAGYLIRQHIKHNLYDRISTRPFLEHVEKLWIMFQLLHALRDAHAHNVFHGDIKTENVLVSSWKWVYLSDWMPFKPVTLPETDSTNFLFYFNTMGRRVCCVAPERFTAQDLQLNGAMDIYSLGCVFAELLMEKPLFTLADSFRYKRGELVPVLDMAEQERELVETMISIDPSKRLSAAQYLEQFKGRLFPAYFWDLYELSKPFSSTTKTSMVDHLWQNFDKIAAMLELEIGKRQEPGPRLPYLVTTPHHCWAPSRSPIREGALIVLAMVCSQLASTPDVSTRLRATDLLLALSAFVPDDIKLNRSLPYLVSLLRDKVPAVQIAAISALTHMLSITSELTSLNESLFTEYLFPRIRSSILAASDDRVKAVYAECLPTLAAAAQLEQNEDASRTQIESHVRVLLVEKASVIRRAVLCNFDTLCARMGRVQTNDIFLSHTVTYLNDRDVHVRKDFFSFVARIGPLVGPASLEQYVIPLMMQSLFLDPLEDVVAVVLSSLVALMELGLVRQKLCWVILAQLVKFFVHPNVYIRTQTFLLVAAAAKWMMPAQIYCLLKPMLEPVLQGVVADFADHRSYIVAVKQPMSYAVYGLMLAWAKESGETLFWANTDTNIAFSPQDKRWLEKLRDAGFNNEDLWQLLLYKDYIRQLTAPKQESGGPDFDPIEHKMMPHTWTEGEIPVGLEHYISRKMATGKYNGDAGLREGLAALSILPEVPGGATPAAAQRTGTLDITGTLVASAKAHRGAVTALAICDDFCFFVTGSDDKLVRLWDTRTISKGASRPINTHEFGAPVKSVCYLNPAAFVVGTSDGKLSFVKVPWTQSEAGPLYAPLKVFDERELGDGYAVAIQFVRDQLWVLKSSCAIQILDLLSNKTHEIHNPIEHGPPTCWCFDRDNNWLAVGTSHGVIDVWDLRFKVLVQSWGIGDLCPITCLQIHPRVSSKWIVVGGGFDRQFTTAWDIQTAECREVFVPSSEESVPSLAPILGAKLVERLALRPLSVSFGNKRTVTAACANGDLAGKHQFLITGGSDCIVRYWDMQSPQKCKVISGLSYDHSGTTYSSRISSTVRTTHEKVCVVKYKPSRKARLTVIQQEELDIGRNHRGTITHVGVMQDLIVSVDEVGYIKVFM